MQKKQSILQPSNKRCVTFRYIPCILPLHKDLWQCLSGIQGGFFHNGWAAILDEKDESPKVYAGNPKACGSLWICGGEAGRRWWEQSGVNMSTRQVALCQLDSSTPLTLTFWDILELQCSFYAFTLHFTLSQSTKPSKIVRAPISRPSQIKVVFTQDKYRSLEKQRLQVVPNNWLQLCVSGQILWQEAQGLVAITYRLTQTCQVHKYFWLNTAQISYY